MTDFSAILAGATLGSIEKPKPIPVGSYQAIIKGTSFAESSKKGTPYIRVTFELAAPLGDVNEVDLEAYGPIQGKTTKVDFYLTDGSMFMLQDFVLEHVGLELQGMTLDQAIPQLVNQAVGIVIKHEVSGENIYANVDKTFSLNTEVEAAAA